MRSGNRSMPRSRRASRRSSKRKCGSGRRLREGRAGHRAAYGQEGVEVSGADPPQPTTSGDNSLRAYCQALEAGCRSSHEWEKEDTETRQAYRFTRCLWAEVYRELDAADIGFWICEGDGPAAAAFNPAIRLSRTKTLMEGDDCCDHVYYVEEQQSNGD